MQNTAVWAGTGLWLHIAPIAAVRGEAADRFVNSGVRNAVEMTVPMSFGEPNVVVGNELRDFLALGLRTGYFVLEKLVYDHDAALTLLNEGFDLEGPARAALASIRESFGLVPWTNVRARPDALEVKYAEALT